jgi:hypothetical protein
MDACVGRIDGTGPIKGGSLRSCTRTCTFTSEDRAGPRSKPSHLDDRSPAPPQSHRLRLKIPTHPPPLSLGQPQNSAIGPWLGWVLGAGRPKLGDPNCTDTFKQTTSNRSGKHITTRGATGKRTSAPYMGGAAPLLAARLKKQNRELYCNVQGRSTVSQGQQSTGREGLALQPPAPHIASQRQLANPGLSAGGIRNTLHVQVTTLQQHATNDPAATLIHYTSPPELLCVLLVVAAGDKSRCSNKRPKHQWSHPCFCVVLAWWCGSQGLAVPWPPRTRSLRPHLCPPPPRPPPPAEVRAALAGRSCP